MGVPVLAGSASGLWLLFSCRGTGFHDATFLGYRPPKSLPLGDGTSRVSGGLGPGCCGAQVLNV